MEEEKAKRILNVLQNITFEEWEFIQRIVNTNFSRQFNKSSFHIDEKTLNSIKDKFIY